MEPVKAWAVIGRVNDRLSRHGGDYLLHAIFPLLKEARLFCVKKHERVIPVLITPIEKEK